MKAAYFPFTYLSEATARRLAALVGPVVVVQPIKTAVPAALNTLASQGLVEIRTPMTDDDDRLHAALREFTEWARMNPGRSTAGTDFLGARQGKVPFFDETAVNQIRSDLRQYSRSDRPADDSDDAFSARLFLALAQENDQAVDRLDQNLERFKTMEKEFLEILEDADEAGFSREALGGDLWREDPGARLTGQRLRAWARLAAADDWIPDVLVTTSLAVVDALVEKAGDGGGFEKLADVLLDVSDENEDPLLGRVLSSLVDGSPALTTDFAGAGLLPAAAGSGIRVGLYAMASQPPQAFIEGLAAANPMQENAKPVGHTLVVLADA